jgi:hypothetical protein
VKSDEMPIRVHNRLQRVEDSVGAAEMYRRILEAVEMAERRRLAEEKERSNDDAA